MEIYKDLSSPASQQYQKLLSSKLSNNKKVAHAWLVDPINGEFITPGLEKNKSLTVYII